jgi:hypothetical protein
MCEMQRVEVWRGGSDPSGALFGPLPGMRDGDVMAYEFELPDHFVPRPGRSRLERTYVLLDLGVSMSVPGWREVRLPNGGTGPGIDAGLIDPQTWYVDLVHIERDGRHYAVRDLCLDVIVPTDGRHHRVLDLDGFADAIEHGTITVSEAIDGLRRWQAFLDRHLHRERDPSARWSDFPPRAIESLAKLPSPLGPPVQWRMAGV